VAITANVTYIVSYLAPQGGYSADRDYFATSGAGTGPLRALATGVDGPNGIYIYAAASTFPTNSYQNSNYWVDAIYNQTAPPDTTPPVISAVQASAIGTNGANISWTTNKPADSQVEYGTTTAYGLSTTIDATLVLGHAQTLSGLQPSTLYHYRVKSRDAAANLGTSGDFTFTTAAPLSCPCSIWTTSATPQVASATDSASVELGVRFRSDTAGYITGIRFYKGAANGGTHVGSLWSAQGALLARVTFSGESPTGWQSATFASPVAITANVTYIVSYLAPQGGYSADRDYFATSGAGGRPLRALATGVDGPNGIYVYAAASTFPTNSYQNSNYWVDAIFTP
jgi:hypothetical protein